MTPVGAARAHQPSLVKAGGWPFLVAGAVGRMPAATLQLGLLMYVTSSGLGFGLGGLTVAANGLGIAAGAPIVGRVADRVGSFPVVAAALIGQTLGLLAMMVVVGWAPHPALVLLCSLVVGMANPQVGPLSRAHWSVLARERREPDLIRIALGYEGAADEVSFVVGPALAGLLVGLLGPNPAMWTLLAFTWVGEGIFLVFVAMQGRTRECAAAAPGSGEAVSRAGMGAEDLVLGRTLWPMLGCASVGMIFGSTQTALTAVTQMVDRPELGGLTYACVGVGSAVMSMVIVRVSAPLSGKIVVGGLVMLGGELLIQQVFGPVAWAGIALMIGLGVGSVLVSSFAAIEVAAPRTRINQAMTSAMTALTLGISLGAAVSGVLVAEPTRGFWPGVGAGLLAVIAGVAVSRLARRPLRRVVFTGDAVRDDG